MTDDDIPLISLLAIQKHLRNQHHPDDAVRELETR